MYLRFYKWTFFLCECFVKLGSRLQLALTIFSPFSPWSITLLTSSFRGDCFPSCVWFEWNLQALPIFDHSTVNSTLFHAMSFIPSPLMMTKHNVSTFLEMVFAEVCRGGLSVKSNEFSILYNLYSLEYSSCAAARYFYGLACLQSLVFHVNFWHV